MKYNLELIKINKDNKYILDNVLEYYQYEFNEFYNFFDDLNKNGRYELISTDKYILNSKYNAFLIIKNDKIAGFIMINNCTKFIKEGIYISEFYILPKYRNGFFSIDVLKYVLNKYIGNIELKVLLTNKKAFKLYELLFKRYLSSFKTHIVNENGDLFKYYNFNTNNLNKALID